MIQGVGRGGFTAPREAIDCGNSGTTMRLLAGVLAGRPFSTHLTGDPSLRRRPMTRVLAPLRARGARAAGRVDPGKPCEETAPLVIGPLERPLQALDYDSPVASAQVKSALLFSGLDAEGPTTVREPFLSRDHTERMLSAAGVPLEAVASVVRLNPAGWDGRLLPIDLHVPGDLSAAAFLVVAGATIPGSRITVRDVGLNPTRTGLLDVMRDMRAGIALEPSGERGGEPVGTLHAWCEPMIGIRAGGELVARAIDEICIACALAAAASGTSAFAGAGELRVKESDRISAMAEMLRRFGVGSEETQDGIRVEGRGEPLEPADVRSFGDHRIAMTATVLALRARGPSRVRDVDSIGTSFPRFVGTLRALGARIEVEGTVDPEPSMG